MWAEKWTSMQEVSGSSTALNAARRISCETPLLINNWQSVDWMTKSNGAGVLIETDFADNNWRILIPKDSQNTLHSHVLAV